mmetsp:Transcript_24769/g.40112  ORF Transcript_24769/g.40112 Transcript_24769/m.40112 type:complete len:587 (-) Transcript_24769:265-2025(-)
MKNTETGNEACKKKKDLASKGWTMVDHDQKGEALETDVDSRAREILKEIDQVKANSNAYLDSVVLNAARQRFPKAVLLAELEDDLDRLLAKQITSQERKLHYLLEETLADSDEEEGGDKAPKGQTDKQLEKRAQAGIQKQLVAAQKAYAALREKALAVQKDHELDFRVPGTCRACRSRPCLRKPAVDAEETRKRMEVLEEELQFVRVNPDVDVFDSVVPRGVKEGGSTRFFRRDLIHVLDQELREHRRALRLEAIDEELHRAYSGTKDYLWLKALNGYDQVLWTDDARTALERARNKLIAEKLAVEVADDILDWMLEGWHFGERPSNLQTAGFVPSIKPGSPVAIKKPELSFDQRQEARKKRDLEQLKAKEDLVNFKTKVLPPDHPDSMWHPTGEKVVKPGNQHDIALKKVHVHLKFGLYCVAAMYFRAIHLLRNPDQARLEMNRAKNRRALIAPIKEATRAKDETGARRRQLQEEKEEASKRRKFRGAVELAKAEARGTAALQRVVRGHIGRKAGLKFSLKVLEYRAFRALVYACVITVQRVFRGWKGRQRASRVRRGIADFILQMGQESDSDDDDELKELMKKI